MRSVLVDLTILDTNTRFHGIGRYVQELACGLGEADGLRISFVEELSASGDARVTADGAAAGERLTARSRPLLDRWPWAYRLRFGLARAAARAGADLVHLPHSGATPLLLPMPRVVTCHDLIPLLYPERYTDWRDGYGVGRRLLDMRRFRTADHVIAISEATASDLRELIGVQPDDISVVYNGIDLARWSPDAGSDDDRRRGALGIEGPFVLYVGDADWRKNHQGMFRALSMARRRAPELRLVWAGRLSDERRSMLEADAEQHGVRDALRLLGFVADADLKAIYRGAVATLFVSYAEGFGLPVLEAMAVGSPVITSDRSSLIEIAHGAAQCVDPSNAAAIADAMVTLARDEGARKALRAKGLERAAAYSLQRQARETIAVYRALLG